MRSDWSIDFRLCDHIFCRYIFASYHHCWTVITSRQQKNSHLVNPQDNSKVIICNTNKKAISKCRANMKSKQCSQFQQNAQSAFNCQFFWIFLHQNLFNNCFYLFYHASSSHRHAFNQYDLEGWLLLLPELDVCIVAGYTCYFHIIGYGMIISAKLFLQGQADESCHH